MNPIPSRRVLSYGDLVKAGEYRVHSRFRRVVNLQPQPGDQHRAGGPPLIALVSEAVGPGPTNIVMRGLDTSAVRAVRITPDTLWLNNTPLALAAGGRYVSTLQPPDVAVAHFEQQLDALETLLIRRGRDWQEIAPRSALFLLDPARIHEFAPGFKRAVADRLSTGVRTLFEASVEAGVRRLKGVGFGLTPSGDDLLVGLLLGLLVGQQVYGTDLDALREQAYRQALGQSPIVNTFLFCAREGRVCIRWKTLLTALLESAPPAQTEAALQRLLAVGATSGADTLVGFLLTIKHFREKGERTW